MIDQNKKTARQKAAKQRAMLRSNEQSNYFKDCRLEITGQARNDSKEATNRVKGCEATSEAEAAESCD